MSILAIDAGTTGVIAAIITPTGRIAGQGQRAFGTHEPRPGWVEFAAEEIWQATLAATREALTGGPGFADLRGIGISNHRDSLLVWDRETLGSPRPAIAAPDRRAAELCVRLRAAGHEPRVEELTGLRLDPRHVGTKLAWLAEHEPHTWALVQSGRYALGTVDSYLIARMTRGTWHLTDVSNAAGTLLLDLAGGVWSAELAELLGVPLDGLAEIAANWDDLARSDPRSFLGLELPVAGIAAAPQAALFGQTCFEPGEAAGYRDEAVLTHTGTRLLRSEPESHPTAAWRAPDGDVEYATEGPPTAAMPAQRHEIVSPSALGVAFMGGLGVGVWGSRAELRRLRAAMPRFEPRQSDRAGPTD